jgi:carbamate kinase
LKKELLVIALGGNALIQDGSKGSVEDHLSVIEQTSKLLLPLFKRDYDIVLTHGNGPQVGNILIQNDEASIKVPPMPLDVCVGKSQGEIGYFLQKAIQNLFYHNSINRGIFTVISQVLVDKKDAAFENPSKPVGQYYNSDQSRKLINEKKWIMQEDPSGKGFRRVVPSPKPIRILETRFIQQMIYQNNIPIAVGGGGIPVCHDNNGNIIGVEAVIDKDLASAQLSIDIKADKFIILTNVSNVYLNFKKKSQLKINDLNLDEANTYHEQGQFSAGSMGPKVQAVIEFLTNGGKEAFITNIENLLPALEYRAGTFIHH